MTVIIEQLYNLIDSVLLTGFLYFYFGIKQKFHPVVVWLASIGVIFLFSNLLTDASWILTLIVYGTVISVIANAFFNGKLSEKIMIVIVANIALALVNMYVITLISRFIDVEYSVLVSSGSSNRFFVAISAKLIYFIFLSLLIALKKKTIFMLSKIEYILIISTFFISFILMYLLRNIIVGLENYYGTFLIALLCVLLLNIGNSFMIFYISKKNIKERNTYLLQKQLELQEENLHNLEQKYSETSQLRHDMKNHISCAIALAEQTDNSSLINYLKELSDEKLSTVDNYVNVGRNVINAIINTKFELAKKSNIDIRCIIVDEMRNVSDTDIGILLGNLLDNAIEACMKNTGSSDILLKIWSDAGYYCIELSNTVEKDILLENPKLKTSKKDTRTHGLGLKSVSSVVKKYNGIINFEQKADRFYVYISLSKINKKSA